MTKVGSRRRRVRGAKPVSSARLTRVRQRVTRLAIAALSCPLSLLLMAGTPPPPPDPPVPKSNDESGLPAGVELRTGGFIDTGNGYSIPGGMPQRTVVDFEVPGSVGQYPLRCARTLVAKPTTGPSQGWGLVDWSFDFHYLYLRQGSGVVRYPNGSLLGGTSTTQQKQLGSGGGGPLGAGPIRTIGAKDTVAFEGGRPVLRMADGGYVEFSELADTGSAQYEQGLWWVGTRIVDRYGLVTTVEPNNAFGPRRVTDASGRWLEFEYDGATVSRVTSSTGESVDYDLVDQVSNSWPLIAGAWYNDGSRARYEFGGFASSCPDDSGQGPESINLPTRLQDVRALSAMPTVRFEYTPDRESPSSCTLKAELADDGTVVSSRIMFGSGLEKYREELPSGEGRTFQFGGGLLTSETDFRGNEWEYEYDDNNFLNKIIDPAGGETTITNTEAYGQPRTITYPDGTSVRYTYTDLDRPFYVRTFEDERGYVTTYHRFPNGVVQRIEYPDGSEESWDDLTAYAQPRIHVLRNGATERFVYDSKGRLLTHWLPKFGTPGGSDPRVRYTYYPDGHVWEDLRETETDPRGNVTRYEYTVVDPPYPPWIYGDTPLPRRGRALPSKIIYADGTFVEYRRDAFGNVLEETDETGGTTISTYDEFNRLLTTTDPTGHTTTYGYERGPRGNPLSHTKTEPTNVWTPSGKLQHRRYDDGNRLIFEKLLGVHSTPGGGTQYTYDELGNQETMTDPQGRVTTYSYYPRGERETMVAPDGRTTRYEYDDSGNETKKIFPNGKFKQWEYDGMSQRTAAIDELGRRTTHLYIDGELRGVVDPQYRWLNFEYDAQGRLDKRWVYGRLHEELEYDAAGNIIERVDGNGTVTEYEYDDRNREWFRLYSDDTPPRQFEYDDAGRPTGIFQSNAQIEYTYDAAGRVRSEDQTSTGFATQTVDYSYDADGNPVLANHQFNAIKATYDESNRVEEILFAPRHLFIATGQLRFEDVVRYVYYSDGRRFSKAFGNGVLVEFDYDSAGRLESQGGSLPTIWRHYDYDPRSRITNVLYGTGFLPGGVFPESLGDTQFDYYGDSQLRLVTSDGVLAPFDALYVYDDSGNRIANGFESYDTNSENQYTSVGGQVGFSYDGNGRMTSQTGNWSYTYDAESRITSADNGTQRFEFGYDGADRLHSISDNGNTRYAVYLSLPRGVAWYDASGTLLEVHVNGPNEDEPVYTWRMNEDLYYHVDKQNSVIGVTDAGGFVQELYTYDGFGAPNIFSPGYAERAESAIDVPYLYTGQRWLPELELYHYKTRAFDPYLGRFLQVDPLGYAPGDANLYRYAFNSPFQYTDPSGEFVETAWDVANVVMGVASFVKNVQEGNYAEAAVDAVTTAIDAASVAVPGVPGGASAAVKAKRAADAVADIAKGTAKAGEAAADVASSAKAAGAAKSAARGGPKPGSAGGPGKGKRFPEKTKDAAEQQAGGKCVFCGKKTTRERGPDQRNTDHAVPKSRDGNNTLENAQNTCRTCNLKKGTSTTDEHLQNQTAQ
ncbi:MAG: RHS repeat-associated core domain-containing protein [Myxococcota bacterium]